MANLSLKEGLDVGCGVIVKIIIYFNNEYILYVALSVVNKYLIPM